ncbi:aspartyl protease family protein [Sediminicola luteus]|uniref:PDZ domain-containing protein n=1 Tax=Sediminicola luteus TaxID=319238 RepID=A0A2A4G432_9FLAO|nr:aspartyl protease family protein [Sediminicola luteus]PCE62730.1 hypothetical protein B7P33_15680 [Sediminicola luteus]
MKAFPSLALFLWFGIMVYGQSAKEQLALANAAQLDHSSGTIAFTYQDKFGYLIVPVNIGSETYDYIFDTGGYNTITTTIMQHNDLNPVMQVEVGSSNQKKAKIDLVSIPTLAVGGIPFTQVGAFNFDFEEAPQIPCYTNGGLIGKGIIRHGIWQIDSEAKQIRFSTELKDMPHMRTAIPIKVKLDKTFNPFFKAKINGQNHRFLLDLGYGGMVSLTQKTAQNLKITNTLEIQGEGSVGAHGSKIENSHLAQLESLQIGSGKIERPIARYAASNNHNLIGADILEHFILTLDFERSTLYLTPLDHKTDKGKTSFGLDFNKGTNGGTAYISRIFGNGPAQKAGLLLYDTIEAVNGQVLTDMEYCDFYDYVNTQLGQETPLTLTVLRKTGIEKVVLKKAHLFTK